MFELGAIRLWVSLMAVRNRRVPTLLVVKGDVEMTWFVDIHSQVPIYVRVVHPHVLLLRHGQAATCTSACARHPRRGERAALLPGSFAQCVCPSPERKLLTRAQSALTKHHPCGSWAQHQTIGHLYTTQRREHLSGFIAVQSWSHQEALQFRVLHLGHGEPGAVLQPGWEGDKEPG